MPFRSLAPLLRLCAAAAVILLLADAALFRSGWYFFLVKPDSSTGSIVNAQLAIEDTYDSARRNILVLGNSRIGEGFSAQIADEVTRGSKLHYINGSVPGTTPRTWYYLLRSIDPDATRFAAIAMMVDYDVVENRQVMADYPLDTNYLIPLLGLADFIDYPASFTSNGERDRARRAIVLPLQALHEDARDLFAHPLDRREDLHRNRKSWLYAVAHYPGREGRVPQLDIDARSGLPEDWSPVDAKLKSQLEGYFHDMREPAPAEIQAANKDYLGAWLGRIAGRYSSRNVPVIVFVVPRGPWHGTLAPIPDPSGPIAELVAKGMVVALPGNAFVELEQPQYFFDPWHMNRDGRENFSRLFARKVAPLVH